MKIGVLALQGAVAEHVRMIEQTGAEGVAIKKAEQLTDMDGIIIPGGESTTIGKLMRTYRFLAPLRQFAAEGKPIFGTCAGLIILAKHIVGQEEVHLGLMDIEVARNAFGRQRESFETDLAFAGIADGIKAVFIRAPLITRAGADVEVLARHEGEIVAARQGHLLAASFHPELTEDIRLHTYFANMVHTYKKNSNKAE